MQQKNKEELIQLYKQSGMRGRAFAEEFELNLCTFRSWQYTYVSRTNRFLESAVIGEIGNNTLYHNLDYDIKHLRGAYFSYSDNGEHVVLADFWRRYKKNYFQSKICY